MIITVIIIFNNSKFIRYYENDVKLENREMQYDACNKNLKKLKC